ncbi:MAG: endonuclease/exonuclease/phosphatase family protein [Chloroflexi bacterium]|nr:endonuclease/exonuclease/phosphatase family protein [Chloroflexota bacterium]
MRILNWNTQWLGPRSRGGRYQAARALIAGHEADVVCLTEARAELMPSGGQTIMSERSGAGAIENSGGRKVVLWSRRRWRNVDTLGSPELPEGRFVRAETEVSGQTWTFVGKCIPYHAYRTGEAWIPNRLKAWEGACRYLDALREDVLPKLRNRERVVLLGDFNLQIPPFGYPRAGSEVDQKRRATFGGWLIPTSGIHRGFIDHVAMSTDLRVDCLRFISKIAPDGQRLSDHNGVCLDVEIVIQPKAPA